MSVPSVHTVFAASIEHFGPSLLFLPSQFLLSASLCTNTDVKDKWNEGVDLLAGHIGLVDEIAVVIVVFAWHHLLVLSYTFKRVKHITTQ